MQSSANTAWVGLIVIVSALLLSTAMLVLGGSGFQLFSGKKYVVYARFDDVTGIQPGMTITANGRPVGNVVKIVEEDGELISSGPIDVKLRIDERVALGPNATAVVTQPELLGDQALALEGLAGPGEAAAVTAGGFIEGVNSGGLAQEISAKANELGTQVQGKLETVVAKSVVTIDNLNEMMVTMTEMMKANQGAVQGTMKNFEAASKNMVALSSSLAQATSAVAELATDPKNKESLQGITANLQSATSSLATMTETMNAMVSDPQVSADAKASLALTKQTLETVNKTLEGLAPTMGKVGEVLDTANTTMKAVGDVAAGVSGIVGGASDAVSGKGKAKGKLQSGISSVTDKVHMRLDMDTRIQDSDDNLSYSGDDLKTRDINAYLGYDELFAQFGADNIGLDDGGMNFLLGHGDPNKGLSWKTGVIRSEVGSGISYRVDKNAGIDATMYDTNDPKYNIRGRMPVGRNFSVIAGMEDITGETEATVGIGVSY